MPRHSSSSSSQVKPERPEGSPLFWHPSRRWCKKIRGKQVYFGRGSHADALAEYERQKADLHAGRTAREEDEGLTVYMLCAKFLTTKTQLRDEGELSPRMVSDYAEICKLIIAVLGKNRLVADLRPDDFEKMRKKVAKNWGPVRVGNTINMVRVVFNYAYKNGLIDRPMVYGEGFRRPSAKTLRKHRQAQGPKMFDREEIRAMIEKAEQPLKAMILLGVNCGFGNSDVGNLPLAALDLENGWVDYPRPKTGVERRCPLWPETVEALKEAVAQAPTPKDEGDAGLAFVTKYGMSWAKDIADSPITKETRKLLNAIGIGGHRNFYALRNTFQTVGDESGDYLSVRKIMGHASNDIADAYRERVSEERLRKVTDYVRTWLFAVEDKGEEKPDVLPMTKTQVR